MDGRYGVTGVVAALSVDLECVNAGELVPVLRQVVTVYRVMVKIMMKSCVLCLKTVKV